ncbi:S8/S53 family peptidase [Streptosporangium sp. NPDC051023]|uniref:S8/S53 family peptidase n=1 Tax=Streptosporangium sp. NPDC051023 TaxID=3155410 RepID=UPI00344D27D1
MEPDRFQEQFDHIQAGMDDVPLAAGPDRKAQFLYQKGHILATEDDADLVIRVVREAFGPDSDRAREVRRVRFDDDDESGVARIRVGDPNAGDRGSDPNVTDALAVIRPLERREDRQIATRNHLVSITVNCCPGDEPVPVPSPASPNPAIYRTLEPVRRPPLRRPVRVMVIDTGLVEGYDTYPWMRGVHPSSKQGGGEKRPFDREGILNLYVGHGTFIAGLIGAVAPQAEVTVFNTLSDPTAVPEDMFAAQLMKALAGGWPDIISLSAGTATTRSQPLLALKNFMAKLQNRPTLLVAAAGNNGNSMKFWPAAHAETKGYEESVVSVGALRTDGADRACFSNHGSWVRVYAPGERLVSAFSPLDGSVETYDYQHSTFSHCRYGSTYDCTCRLPQHVGEASERIAFTDASQDRVRFDGMARWSGTSFAVPLVVGMIADHMRARGIREPRVAARDLIRGASSLKIHNRVVSALTPPTWTPSQVTTIA